jgi:hypothetical protein
VEQSNSVNENFGKGVYFRLTIIRISYFVSFKLKTVKMKRLRREVCGWENVNKHTRHAKHVETGVATTRDQLVNFRIVKRWYGYCANMQGLYLRKLAGGICA